MGLASEVSDRPPLNVVAGLLLEAADGDAALVKRLRRPVRQTRTYNKDQLSGGSKKYLPLAPKVAAKLSSAQQPLDPAYLAFISAITPSAPMRSKRTAQSGRMMRNIVPAAVVVAALLALFAHSQDLSYTRTFIGLPAVQRPVAQAQPPASVASQEATLPVLPNPGAMQTAAVAYEPAHAVSSAPETARVTDPAANPARSTAPAGESSAKHNDSPTQVNSSATAERPKRLPEIHARVAQAGTQLADLLPPEPKSADASPQGDEASLAQQHDAPASRPMSLAPLASEPGVKQATASTMERTGPSAEPTAKRNDLPVNIDDQFSQTAESANRLAEIRTRIAQAKNQLAALRRVASASDYPRVAMGAERPVTVAPAQNSTSAGSSLPQQLALARAALVNRDQRAARGLMEEAQTSIVFQPVSISPGRVSAAASQITEALIMLGDGNQERALQCLNQAIAAVRQIL